MRLVTIFLSVLAVVIAILIALPTPESDIDDINTPNPNNSFTIVNATFFDGNKWRKNETLHVINGIFSNKAPANQQVIDAQNQFIIPGMIDAHTHSWGNALKQALEFGVTTQLDMFTNLNFFQQYKAQRNQLAQVSEADIFSAGTLVTSKGGHGTQFGFAIDTIDNAQQAEEFVKRRLDEGSDYIKIVYHYKKDYGPFTSIDYATLQAVIDASHQQGTQAVVHISDQQSALEAVQAGADGLVHTFGDELVSEQLLQLMKNNQVFVIPTLSVIASMANSDHRQQLVDSPWLVEKLSSATKSRLNQYFVTGMSRESSQQQLENALENTRRMHTMGIDILAGTDAPNPGTVHGVSMFSELSLLIESGLSPIEALQSATSKPANRFQLGQRGEIRPGARADFILLRADPRNDISHVQSIQAIYKNGYLHDTESRQTDKPKLVAKGLISDFIAAEQLPKNGTRFTQTSDQMMGGKSAATLKWQPKGCDDAGSIKATGEINPGFIAPWAGIFFMFFDNMNESINLEAYTHLSFNHFGTPGSYRLMVFTEDATQPNMITFNVEAGCQNMQLVFSEHPAVNWQAVTAFAWVAGQEQKQFELSIDNVAIH